MTQEIKAFKFPTWDEIVERNRPFLERGEYKGYHLQIPVSDNLYLLIDCQNEACVFPNNENIIRFAWGTKNEFAITSARYVNCEAGYLMGCAHLVSTANEFKKCFEEFAGSNVFDVRRRINRYQTEHPESETESATKSNEKEDIEYG